MKYLWMTGLMILVFGLENGRHAGVIETYYWLPWWSVFWLVPAVSVGIVAAWCGGRAAARCGMLVVAGLIVLAALSGCVSPDPLRAAIAQERVNHAAVAANSSAAQISQAQTANADARRAQEELHRLQSLAAEREARAIEAQAMAEQNIAAINGATQVATLEILAEAAQPDNTAVYVVVAVLAIIVVIVIVVMARMNMTMAQAMARSPAAQQWRALPKPTPRSVAMLPPPGVQRQAEQRGAVALWHDDGGYWYLVNEQTGQTWTPRRRLTG